MRERTTERLRLEPIRREHAADLWQLHQDDGIAAWWGGKWTHAYADEWATTFERAWARDGVSKWIAYDRVDGSLVGRGGLSRAPVDGEIRLEIGWTVHERFWGQGYASEIGRAGLDFAFGELGETEVVAFTEPHNARSRAVMERLGMQYQRDITHHGGPYVLYAIDAPKD
jgi:[ribosomal protein S5]-alanine N-acetyltransferase